MRFFVVLFGFVIFLPVAYLIFLQGSAIIPAAETNPLYVNVIKSDDRRTRDDERPIAWYNNPYKELSWLDHLYIRWAIAKFPNFDSCKDSDTDPDLNWSRIKTKQQLLLCVHHLVHHYDSRSEYVEWLADTGMSFEENEVRVFRNSLYVPNGEIEVTFGLRNQSNVNVGKMHGLFIVIPLRVLCGGAGVTVRYSEEGEIQTVGYLFVSPIN